MGATFSQQEYKERLNIFQKEFLTLEHSSQLDKFLMASDDFSNVFTTVGLDDFRKIKDSKIDNVIHIVSHSVKIMHDFATKVKVIQKEEDVAKIKGAIHVLNRIFPLLFEDKDLFIRCMWREQALFNSQINAINMMESISLLLFKEGFTIMPLSENIQPLYFGIDENLVWRSGISVPAATNHDVFKFDKNRIDLLRLIITILSQPLFYAPDEYLLVLNPFSTYFSNKRSKNCKNLFVSLINIIVSYDVSGYGLPYLSAIDQQGEQEMLITLAIHLMLILIEYKPPSYDNLNFLIRGGHISLNKVFQYFMMESGAMKPKVGAQGSLASQYEIDQQLQEQIIEDLTSNEFFRLLRVIHGRMNLDPLYEGFCKYFQNIIDTNATYLPQSLNLIPFYQEISILLWRFMTLNTHVFEDFTERSDFHQTILLGVIILMDQSKKDPTKSNLMYLSIFLLLTISASRELAMNLNTPFTYNIMLDCIEAKGWSTSGKKLSYSDLVFISVYGLIKNGPRLLRPIYKSIVAVLSNIAPYTKSLCKEGCEGLMYLLNVFAKNEFLLEKEDNCKSMSSLMEAINYLIAYHDESNHYLQVMLMKYQGVFEYLEQNVGEMGTVRSIDNTSDKDGYIEVKQNAQDVPEQLDADQENQNARLEQEQLNQEIQKENDSDQLSQQIDNEQIDQQLALQIDRNEQVIDEQVQNNQNDFMQAFLQKSIQKETIIQPQKEDNVQKEHVEEYKQITVQKSDEQNESIHSNQQDNTLNELTENQQNEEVKTDQQFEKTIEPESKSNDKQNTDNQQDDESNNGEEKPELAATKQKKKKNKKKGGDKIKNPYQQEEETEQKEGGEGDDEQSEEDEWHQQAENQNEQSLNSPTNNHTVRPLSESSNGSESKSQSNIQSVQLKEGEKIQTKHINQQPFSQIQNPQQNNQPKQYVNDQGVAVNSQEIQDSNYIARYPEREWFIEWKKQLNLPNIRACISHTYNKAMNIRNQMIENDYSLQSLQIFNIDEEILLQHLKKYSLKGLLPVMPKILVTTYKGNDSIDTWLISYLWGLIFVFAQEYNVYDHRRFKLFTINTYQGQSTTSSQI